MIVNQQSETMPREVNEEEEEEEEEVNEITYSAVVVDQAQFEIDKRNVYKHPLFPLLALLFEKCEIASQSAPETPLSQSFVQDLEAFIEHQDRKRFLVDDDEIDGLMIKSIQVLRIHLLELDKVQELCKDFCQRYINCLKTKMQSENLLRSDVYDKNSTTSAGSLFDGENTSRSNSPQSNLSSSFDNYSYNDYNNAKIPISQIGSNSSSLSSNDLHHQQSHLQQHGHQQPPHPHQSFHFTDDYSSEVMSTGAPASTTFSDNDDSEDVCKSKQHQQKRGVLPKHATSIMRSWLFQHIVHPYPTEDEKREIANQTNLTLLQVNNWFINARRRILQPMLDATTTTTTPTSTTTTNVTHENSDYGPSRSKRIKNDKVSNTMSSSSSSNSSTTSTDDDEEDDEKV